MKRFAGLLLLAAAIIAVVVYQMRSRRAASPGAASTGTARAGDVQRVKGYVGGEKIGFLDDPRVKDILANRYGVAVDYEKRGSIEMVSGDVSGQDFLWPSSQFAAEKFRSRQAADPRGETIFNSPIVLYSWAPITNALQQQGLLRRNGDTLYLSDAPGFIKLITTGKRWKEIGVPQLYGKVTIFSTDPNRSNSGTMFAALLATLLNDGDVPDEQSIERQLPAIHHFFGRLGYMEASSADLFKQFLNTGVGANPIIVGYENQMIEYSLEHPEQLDVLKQNVRVIYPVPTMWSSHPLIALTDNGRKLLAAMKDPEIQRLAWERHGFRSGLSGVPTDLRAVRVVGVPQTIDAVVPMPSPPVMDRILVTLGERAEQQQPETATTSAK